MLVPGGPSQKIVCKVVGNPDGSRLWWFVDGATVGESTGTEPFAVEMAPGEHEIACSTAEGVSASVTVVCEQRRRVDAARPPRVFLPFFICSTGDSFDIIPAVGDLIKEAVAGSPKPRRIWE